MGVGRFAGFALDQAAKTIKRPARLLTLAGYQLFDHDRPTAAWRCLQLSRALGRPSIAENLLAANCLYQGLGRPGEAVALLARANARDLREAEKLGIGASRYRVLDSIWVRHIGHLGIADYVVKLGILEGRRLEDTILYVPRGTPIANRFLLQEITSHLRLVENPADLPFPPDAVQALHYDLFAPRLPDRTTAHYWKLAGEVYARWYQEGRAPLFKYPSEMSEAGWARLHKAGIPRGAWFVALHVREREPDGRASNINAARNADISTYFPAIAEIARRGGWVIRLGDPSMTVLPALPNVLDYSHSPIRADWMDIFLLASCRFFIGTNSGPAFIPPIYGVPQVLTNWWPVAERPWQPGDIFIPKMLRTISDNRYLSLAEMLSGPFGWCYSRRYLARNGDVHVENNDAEIVRAGVAEMLDRLAGRTSLDPQLAQLRARADRLYESHGLAGSAQLAAEFVRRHADLIA